jgi:type IV pilus biogenesis protein CpaD/CtpE
MKPLRIIFLAAGCLTVSACDRFWVEQYLVRKDTNSYGAGDSNAWNEALQVPDPWPRYSNNRNIAFDAERLQGAVRQYRMGPPAKEASADAPRVNRPEPGDDSASGWATPPGAAGGGVPAVGGGPPPGY